MKRIRWFNLNSNGELGKIEQQIRSRIFSINEPVSSGFRIENTSSVGLVGQFVYKRTVDQKIVLPSGEEFTQEIANIEITKFGIDFFQDRSQLYLVDPPRSTTPFFSTFSAATQFGCSLEPMEVNVNGWIEHLLKHNERISVTYLDVVNISLPQGAKARVAISGEKDITAIFKEFMPFAQQGKIDSARLRYPMKDGTSFVVELGCRASVKAPTAFPIEEIQEIRNAMLLSIEK